MQPAGVAGTWSGVPRKRFPALNGWIPSTSFGGDTAYVTRVSSIWAGSGSCTRIPSIESSRFRLSTSASTSSSVASCGRRASRASIPASVAALCFREM